MTGTTGVARDVANRDAVRWRGDRVVVGRNGGDQDAVGWRGTGDWGAVGRDSL